MNAHVPTQRRACRTVLTGLTSLCWKSKLASIYHAFVLRDLILQCFSNQQCELHWYMNKHNNRGQWHNTYCYYQFYIESLWLFTPWDSYITFMSKLSRNPREKPYFAFAFKYPLYRAPFHQQHATWLSFYAYSHTDHMTRIKIYLLTKIIKCFSSMHISSSFHACNTGEITAETERGTAVKLTHCKTREGNWN